ncbi:MAG: putative zinc-binding protein [Bacillota bacterium]|nr:putative zinc-binding protein [Bacillota bacterium]
MTQPMEWQPGMVTHENAIFVCFGGLSNTGYITALAGMEAVRRVGLKKAAIFCLAGLPVEVKMVLAKAKAAKKIITVDGCANNCAKKLVEAAGFPITRSITLAVDLGVKKVPLHRDLDGEPKDVMEYISQEDVARTVEAILAAIEGEEPAAASASGGEA